MRTNVKTLFRIGFCALLAVGAVFCGVLAFQSGQSYSENRLHDRAQESVRMRAMALQGMLSTQRAVATVLAQDATIRLALTDPDALNTASRKLEQLRDDTGSASIYLIEKGGKAVAASNWRNEESFIGVDYTFRTYFQSALHNGQGYEFTTGHTTRRPGLHLSRAVYANDDETGPILGVIVVKIEFDDLARAWAQSDDLTWVSGADQATLIVSNPTMADLDMPGNSISAAIPIAGLDDWVMHVRLPEDAGQYSGYVALAAYIWGLSLCAMAIWAWRTHQARANRRLADAARYSASLETAVDLRTAELQNEIIEHKATEARVEELRRDLQQASRLSTLGQITSGVAHEVNQPLSVIRLLAENADQPARAPSPELHRDLAMILRMCERIGQITDNLRHFARKTSAPLGPVSLKQAIDNSRLLTSSLPQAGFVQLHVQEFDPTLQVIGEAVPLEQILVNLIHNAYDAVPHDGSGRIDLGVAVAGDQVEVSLTDNGPGISPKVAESLFEPFITSKSQGLGLGLVISRKIADQFGGTLRFDPGPPTVLKLVLVKA